ncbi:MAG TPA: ATP-binding cassette domain-containing protein, partial [Planctomycetes bacterium]|nr:ATP-binding cassette domain-containing protein [Planctomycetota bacterium]
MSITCHCSLCGKIYQVKSRFAGKQARCSCGNVMHVPEAQSDGGGPSSAAAGRPHGAILFLCPQCGYQARVAALLEGKKASCPGCKTVVVVDAAPATPGPSATTSARENVPQVDQESGYFEKIKQQGGALARKLIEKGQQVYDHAILQVSALDSVQSDAPSAIPIGEDLVIGRDPEACQYILDHPGISRQHARIERSQPDYLVTDLKSANGTYVNGRRILGRAPLEPGDMLNIGPFTFTIDGAALVPVADADKVEIVCSELCKDVTDWTSGEQIRILNDITLLLQPREFTVIIGPSGGGKSTLLNALSARRPATSGVVLFNRQNLYTHFDAIRKNMALVPQKDVLHSELQLGRALLYTARLRLPPDLGTEGYMAVVDEYLETVGLTDCKTTQIRSLSGGQVKRASLANEIISQPNLLFVDEATSGVDEHTDREIMRIFREIAEGGKTVVCITHNLTNVEKSCHKVVILAPGGFLAFVGTPGEARSYFDIDTLGDVYYRLNDKPGEQWKNEFAATPVYQQMQRDVQERVQSSQVEVEMRRSEPLVRTLVVFFRQLFLLSRRGFDILVADTKSLMVTGVQCLF